MANIVIKYIPHPKPNPENQIANQSHVSGVVELNGDRIGDVYFDKIQMLNEPEFRFSLNFCHKDAARNEPDFIRHVSYPFRKHVKEADIRAGMSIIANELKNRYASKYPNINFTCAVVE